MSRARPLGSDSMLQRFEVPPELRPGACDPVVAYAAAVTTALSRNRWACVPTAGANISADAGDLDETPFDCWRCDAAESDTKLGLCSPCLAVLRGTP